MAKTNDKNLKKLQRLLQAMDEDSLTRSEFTEQFSKVLKFMNSLKEKNQGEFSSLNKKWDDFSNKLGSDTKTERINIDKLFNELSSNLNRLVDNKLSSVKDGLPGLDADEDRVSIVASERALEAVRPLIPTTSTLKKDIAKMGKLIRKILKKKLRISDIKGLKEALKKQGGVHSLSGGSGGIGGSVRYYDISASLNGATKTFSLPAFARVLSVQSSSFPNAFRETTDYTTDGSAFTITFTAQITAGTTLNTGQTITILYATQ